MNNYKLTIQYDGTDYAGWQIQQNAKTVQETLSGCIKQIIQQEINLIGSGRTDSGVHALGQTANFKTEKELDLYKFKYALNSVLPVDISVIEIINAEDNFHARFDAKKRSYIYVFTEDKNPFYFKYAYMYYDKIDVLKLNKLSVLFLGEKDFSSFSKVNTDVKNKICTVYEAHWRKSKEFYIFYIEADRFLYGMVRAIIGTLLRSLNEEDSEGYINNVIRELNREAAADSVPAKGLFLYKVKY